MLADPLQDIDQMVVGIDVVEAASGQQALHNADLFSPQFRPAEQPVPSSPIRREPHIGFIGHIPISFNWLYFFVCN